MYYSPLISIIKRFDPSIHQPLMKISSIPITFYDLFSHSLKNKGVSFIRTSRVNRISQEDRPLWRNKIFKGDQSTFYSVLGCFVSFCFISFLFFTLLPMLRFHRTICK